MALARGLRKGLRMGLVAGVGVAVVRAARARRAAGRVAAPPSWPPLPSVLAEKPPAVTTSLEGHPVGQVVEPPVAAALVAEAAVLEAAGVTEGAEVDPEAVAALRTPSDVGAAAVTPDDDLLASWPPPTPGTAVAGGELPPPLDQEQEMVDSGEARWAADFLAGAPAAEVTATAEEATPGTASPGFVHLADETDGGTGTWVDDGTDDLITEPTPAIEADPAVDEILDGESAIADEGAEADDGAAEVHGEMPDEAQGAIGWEAEAPWATALVDDIRSDSEGDAAEFASGGSTADEAAEAQAEAAAEVEAAAAGDAQAEAEAEAEAAAVAEAEAAAAAQAQAAAEAEAAAEAAAAVEAHAAAAALAAAEAAAAAAQAHAAAEAAAAAEAQAAAEAVAAIAEAHAADGALAAAEAEAAAKVAAAASDALAEAEAAGASETEPVAVQPAGDLDAMILAEEAALEEERLEAERLELARLEAARLRAEDEAASEAQLESKAESEDALARFEAQREEAQMLLALQGEREERARVEDMPADGRRPIMAADLPGGRRHDDEEDYEQDDLVPRPDLSDALPETEIDELAEPAVGDDLADGIDGLTWPEEVRELELSTRLVEEDELSTPALVPLIPDEAVADLGEDPAWGGAPDVEQEPATAFTEAELDPEDDELADEIEDEQLEPEWEVLTEAEPEPTLFGSVDPSAGVEPSDAGGRGSPIMTGDLDEVAADDRLDEEDDLALARLRRKRREALARFIAKREEAELLLAKQDERAAKAPATSSPDVELDAEAEAHTGSEPADPSAGEVVAEPLEPEVTRAPVGRIHRPLMAGDFDDLPTEELIDDEVEEDDEREAEIAARASRRSGRPRVPLKARRLPETGADDEPAPRPRPGRAKRPAPAKAVDDAVVPVPPGKSTRVAKSSAERAATAAPTRVGTTRVAKRSPAAAKAKAPAPASAAARAKPLVTSEVRRPTTKKAVVAPSPAGSRGASTPVRAAKASKASKASKAPTASRTIRTPKATAASARAASKPAPAAKATGSKKVSTRRGKADLRWVEPIGGACPVSHPVKASLSSGIFHIVGGLFYDRSTPDRCYRTAAMAKADGLRQAKR